MGIVSFFRCLKEGKMDYEGQRKAFYIQLMLIITSGIIGFFYGYAVQRFLYTFYILSAGTALATVITLPSWPAFNRNPVKFLPVKGGKDD
ncbi:Signal peptidase complex subunit 1 [Perkinsus olseni]|nr:Signal peptidase complex subunit 1 [Perkinsus olseni]